MLLALEDLHRRGITHGNLTRSSFVWSNDDYCWKLAGLEHASYNGDLCFPPIVCHYTSPELAAAIATKRHNVVDIDPPMDVWSFGIILSELFLNGMRISSPARNGRVPCAGNFRLDVGRQRSLRDADQNDAFRAATITPSISRSYHTHASPSTNHFIYRFLAIEPMQRITVTQALDDVFFSPGNYVDRTLGIENQVMSFLTSPNAGRHLFDVSFALEDTSTNETFAVPLPFGGYQATPSTERPAAILRIHPNDSRRLRIDVIGHPAMRSPTWSVQQLSIHTPDGASIAPPFEQRCFDTRVEVAAPLSGVISLLNDLPGEDRSQTRRCIEVEVRLRIVLDDLPSCLINAGAWLMLKIVPGERGRVRRRLHLVWSQLLSRLPQSTRTVVRRMSFFVPKERTSIRDVSTV